MHSKNEEKTDEGKFGKGGSINEEKGEMLELSIHWTMFDIIIQKFFKLFLYFFEFFPLLFEVQFEVKFSLVWRRKSDSNT